MLLLAMVATTIAQAVPRQGKYSAEHTSALGAIESARGFSSEHASALRSIGEAGA